jgi:hypothetical protein
VPFRHRRPQRAVSLAAAFLLAGLGAASLWASPGDSGDKGSRGDRGGPKEARSLAVGPVGDSAELTWSAHDARQASFELYLDDERAGATDDTRFTFRNLPCGRSLVLGVEVVDKQGRHSDRATLAVRTPGCPLFVATDGSDAGACSREAPCETFGAAYRKAAPGQRVLVAAGTYPGQVIVFDPKKTSAEDVVIEPVPGARVVLSGALQLGTWNGDGPRHLTVKDLVAVPYDGVHYTSWQAGEGTQDVTWVNLRASNFYIRGVKDFHIVGGSWGPCIVPTQVPDACNNNKIDYSPEPFRNDNVTIDGATFHNMQCRDHDCGDTGVHFECLFLAGGTNIKVRNSTFRDCEFYDIFATRISEEAAGSFRGLVIENNWFDTPWDGQGHQNRGSSIAFAPWEGQRGPVFEDVLVRYNSFGSGIGVNENSTGHTYRNFRIVGNVLEGPDGCYPSATYAYNVWRDGTCSSTDRSLGGGPLPYASARGLDFHLTGGPAVDLVPGTHGDQRIDDDIDGDGRPAARMYDAGADERTPRR